MQTIKELTPEQISKGVGNLMQGYKNQGYQPEGLHTYNDEQGIPIYWRARLRNSKDKTEKRIFPVSFNEGKFELKEPEFLGKKPLYQLHRIKDAQIIHFVEGEKCADKLSKLGLVATTSGGTTSHNKADFEPLRGKEIYIWPDKDEHGLEFSNAVKEILLAMDCIVHMLDVSALGLPPKGDAVDWLYLHQEATKESVLSLPCIQDEAITSTATAPKIGLEKAITPQSSEWIEPESLPDELPPVMQFDKNLLPFALREWVADIAHRMQCPADFTAIGALVAISSVIGARAVIQPKEKDDWQVTPNLWGAVIGRPGVMKSPALNEVLKHLKRLEANETERFKALHEEWESDLQLAEMQNEKNRVDARANSIKDPAKAKALLNAYPLPPEPMSRRFIVNDATVEKLGEILAVNPYGLYGLLTSMDKPGQEEARGFYLQSYDGNQSYTFERIGRGTVPIKNLCLSLIGGIQPGKIKNYVRGAISGGTGDDGLLQRFGLAVYPDIGREFKNIDQLPDLKAKAMAWGVFERLGQLQPNSEGLPIIWRFTPEAQEIFLEWRIPFEMELKRGELHPAMESHLSKYRKLVPALALIFALIDTPDSGALIGENELIRAISWAEYLRTHANRIYAVATIPEVAGAKALLKKIKKGEIIKDGIAVNGFTRRQIYSNHWTELDTPEAVEKATDVLVEYGYLSYEKLATGGAPSDYYTINPLIMKGLKNG